MYAQIKKPKKKTSRAVSSSVRQKKSNKKRGHALFRDRREAGPRHKINAFEHKQPTTQLSSVIQRTEIELYTEGNKRWTYDDETHELKMNGITMISGVPNIDEAAKVLLNKFKYIKETYKEPVPSHMDIEGDVEAQMLDRNSSGDFMEEEDIIFSGEPEMVCISDDESVSSAGASTCVIVIMVAKSSLDGKKYAVCKHFTAGTDHFNDPSEYLADMAGFLGKSDKKDIKLYAVGGMVTPGMNEYLRLASAVNAYDVEFFNVPAFDPSKDTEIESVEAQYSQAGFLWKFDKK